MIRIYNFTTFVITIIIFTINIYSLRINNIIHSSDDVSHNQFNYYTSHQQYGRPIYDQQRYLVNLAQTQNSFKQKLSKIQSGFAAINIILNDPSLNQNQKSIKLAEAIADQRQILISAQSQLNIPFELKSCQCLNLNQQKRIDIRNQLQKVRQKISELQKTSVQTNKHCESHNCTLLKQINGQIKMIKNYQTIMQNTIDSKCCQVVKYTYRDNLDAKNWHWGNTSQSDYQAAVYQKQQGTGVRLQPCPISQPWANSQTNSCFQCPINRPLFNIGTRSCEVDCTQYSKNSAYVLNLNTHICGYNTNCPSGQYFDETFRRCAVIPSYTNQSSCPPQRPFWDPVSYSCQSCPSTTPYFDVKLKSCRSCNTNQVWNANTRACQLSKNCGSGYYYDASTNNCIKQTNDTHSLCPPQRPFWNQASYSCDQCTNDKPYYDPLSKICRVCSDQQQFNLFTKQCVQKTTRPTCISDQFFNTQTNRCQKRGTTSMCPPSTPYWDSVNFRCTQCPAATPAFNQKTHQCEACPLYHQWSNTYLQCIQHCGYGQEWNHTYKRCIKTNRACPQKYRFDFYLNQCVEINCNETNPYWNSTLSLCQPCPAGTIYNYATVSCEKDTRSGNISVCHEDKPVWNAQYLRCEPCPQGKSWDLQLKSCVSSNTTKASHNHHNLGYSQQIQERHKQQFIQGHVYGDSKYLYQYHDLSDLMG